MWTLRRSASGAPILLLSLPLLGVARLLPAYGFGLWLRLVAASLVLLLPGALVARALRLRGASVTVAWGLGALGPALLLAIVLFCIPVAVHGFRQWSPAASVDRYAPTPGLLHALLTKVPERAIVFSDLETSYRIGAYAPVYVAAAPPAHVADTASNHPYRRRLAVIRFFRFGEVSILDRYHAGWLVVDKRRFHVRTQWQLVYEDQTYALYHRPS